MPIYATSCITQNYLWTTQLKFNCFNALPVLWHSFVPRHTVSRSLHTVCCSLYWSRVTASLALHFWVTDWIVCCQSVRITNITSEKSSHTFQQLATFNSLWKFKWHLPRNSSKLRRQSTNFKPKRGSCYPAMKEKSPLLVNTSWSLMYGEVQTHLQPITTSAPQKSSKRLQLISDH